MNLDLNKIQKSIKIINLDNSNVKFIVPEKLRIKSVSIYNLLGKKLYLFKSNNPEETYNLSRLKHAIYIAKIKLSNGQIITKKAIK